MKGVGDESKSSASWQQNVEALPQPHLARQQPAGSAAALVDWEMHFPSSA